MNRQQALNQLRIMQAWHEDFGNGPCPDYDAICYAIGVIEEAPEGLDNLIKVLEKEHKKLLEMQKALKNVPDTNVRDTISRQAAIDAVTDELDMIDHVPQWVFDRLEGRLKQLTPAQLGTNLAEVGTEERAEERTETHACDCINRQQAIDEIDEWIKAFRENGHKESAADACLIQDGIIQLPPAHPEPCEDAVSRKDCLQALSHLMDVEGFRSGWAVSRANVECMLKAMPPVTPKQRKEILYRHYKGGTYELVCNNVTHTETGEALVVYRDCQGQLWARPELMFYGLVKVGDDLVPRFVLCRSEGDTE